MDYLKEIKIIGISDDVIHFEHNVDIYSKHDQCCCEDHYLSLRDLDFDDLKDLTFDLSNDEFFERIEGYGIALKPLNGYPVRIPGYGSNNGYYSSNLDLVVSGKDYRKEYDITDCQDWDGY